MESVSLDNSTTTIRTEPRAEALFQESCKSMHQRADRLFAQLMIAQWLAGIAAAVWISPYTWIGGSSYIHWHVWAAVFLGGAITSLPVYLVWKQPGQPLTRHVIAAAQMLTSALLIHLTGGRIETHFHIFGSLAFLAFYRDWRVLLTATIVTTFDHMTRGIFWPQSVFGVMTSSSLRWLEHTGWVLFENTFLFVSIRHAVSDMREVALRQANLEALNANIEMKIAARTAELTAAHQELQSSEQRFRTLSDFAPIGIYLTDAQGRALYNNPHWLRISGLTLAESLGQGWQQALHPEDAEAVARDWQASSNGSRRFDYEFRFRMRTGEIRWVHARAVAIRSAKGEITGHVGTTEDITERKLAEEKNLTSLKEIRDLNSALDASSIVAITDQRGIITSVNDQFCAISKYSREELVGRDHRIINSGYHSKNFIRELWATLVQGRIWKGDICNRAKDGTYYWVQTTIVPFLDAQEKPLRYVAIRADITARKLAEANLEKLHKDMIQTSRQAGMAEVATSVLHNVGNVLNSVNVSAQVVSDKIKKSKSGNVTKVAAMLREHNHDLATFITEDRRGKQLPGFMNLLAENLETEQAAVLIELESLQKNIEHIKEVVAMQQGYAKVTGMTEPVNIAELLEDTIRMNAASLARNEMVIVREFARVPPVETDKHKLLQILVNLVRNAKQACDAARHDHKQITLRITGNGERVRISVSDNGVGIPPENLDRIFNHGFTTKKDGHGFGLHSGALAAKEMGGTLSVASAGTDCGATFTLDLPLVPDQPAATNAVEGS